LMYEITQIRVRDNCNGLLMAFHHARGFPALSQSFRTTKISRLNAIESEN
jgi:hypothetical protein